MAMSGKHGSVQKGDKDICLRAVGEVSKGFRPVRAPRECAAQPRWRAVFPGGADGGSSLDWERHNTKRWWT